MWIVRERELGGEGEQSFGEEGGREEEGASRCREGVRRRVGRNGSGKITRRGWKRRDDLGRGAHTRARSRVVVITAGLREAGENVGGRAYGEVLAFDAPLRSRRDHVPGPHRAPGFLHSPRRARRRRRLHPGARSRRSAWPCWSGCCYPFHPGPPVLGPAEVIASGRRDVPALRRLTAARGLVLSLSHPNIIRDAHAGRVRVEIGG